MDGKAGKHRSVAGHAEQEGASKGAGRAASRETASGLSLMKFFGGTPAKQTAPSTSSKAHVGAASAASNTAAYIAEFGTSLGAVPPELRDMIQAQLPPGAVVEGAYQVKLPLQTALQMTGLSERYGPCIPLGDPAAAEFMSGLARQGGDAAAGTGGRAQKRPDAQGAAATAGTRVAETGAATTAAGAGAGTAHKGVPAPAAVPAAPAAVAGTGMGDSKGKGANKGQATAGKPSSAVPEGALKKIAALLQMEEATPAPLPRGAGSLKQLSRVLRLSGMSADVITFFFGLLSTQHLHELATIFEGRERITGFALSAAFGSLSAMDMPQMQSIMGRLVEHEGFDKWLQEACADEWDGDEGGVAFMPSLVHEIGAALERQRNAVAATSPSTVGVTKGASPATGSGAESAIHGPSSSAGSKTTSSGASASSSQLTRLLRSSGMSADLVAYLFNLLPPPHLPEFAEALEGKERVTSTALSIAIGGLSGLNMQETQAILAQFTAHKDFDAWIKEACADEWDGDEEVTFTPSLMNEVDAALSKQLRKAAPSSPSTASTSKAAPPGTAGTAASSTHPPLSNGGSKAANSAAFAPSALSSPSSAAKQGSAAAYSSAAQGFGSPSPATNPAAGTSKSSGGLGESMKKAAQRMFAAKDTKKKAPAAPAAASAAFTGIQASAGANNMTSTHKAGSAADRSSTASTRSQPSPAGAGAGAATNPHAASNPSHCAFSGCGKALRVQWMCSGCRCRFFCSERCQKRDWKGHKETCKRIERKLIPEEMKRATAGDYEARTTLSVRWLHSMDPAAKGKGRVNPFENPMDMMACMGGDENVPRDPQVTYLRSKINTDIILHSYNAKARKEEFEDLRAAADAGHLEAQRLLSQWYLEVEAGEKEETSRNHRLSYRYLSTAAAGGHASSQWEFWDTRERALRASGAAPKPAKAAVVNGWLREAAEGNCVRAMVVLGQRYFLGQGVARSPKLYFKWTRRAAKAGDILACFNVGQAYKDGYGCVKNQSKAEKWFRKALERDIRGGQATGIAQMATEELRRLGVL